MHMAPACILACMFLQFQQCRLGPMCGPGVYPVHVISHHTLGGHPKLTFGCCSHVSVCRVVGWYHSHPTFPTQPSRIDIYNQVGSPCLYWLPC